MRVQHDARRDVQIRNQLLHVLGRYESGVEGHGRRRVDLEGDGRAHDRGAVQRDVGVVQPTQHRLVPKLVNVAAPRLEPRRSLAAVGACDHRRQPAASKLRRVAKVIDAMRAHDNGVTRSDGGAIGTRARFLAHLLVAAARAAATLAAAAVALTAAAAAAAVALAIGRSARLLPALGGFQRPAVDVRFARAGVARSHHQLQLLLIELLTRRGRPRPPRACPPTAAFSSPPALALSGQGGGGGVLDPQAHTYSSAGPAWEATYVMV